MSSGGTVRARATPHSLGMNAPLESATMVENVTGDFWAKDGQIPTDYIYRHHVAPRSQRFVAQEPSFSSSSGG